MLLSTRYDPTLSPSSSSTRTPADLGHLSIFLALFLLKHTGSRCAYLPGQFLFPLFYFYNSLIFSVFVADCRFAFRSSSFSDRRCWTRCGSVRGGSCFDQGFGALSEEGSEWGI